MAADSPFGPAPTTMASGGGAIRLLQGCASHDARAFRVLVLALAVRARPRRHLPRRLHRHAEPVPSPRRRARPAAGGAVLEGVAVPVRAEHLPLGGVGSRLSR